MSYFVFDNKKIYYNALGTGIPLIFLHGNTASSMMFHEIAEKYKDNFKVILNKTSVYQVDYNIRNKIFMISI